MNTNLNLLLACLPNILAIGLALIVLVPVAVLVLKNQSAR
jgi:hypothetical protein